MVAVAESGVPIVVPFPLTDAIVAITVSFPS
jgi:hypothetical protein